jgi:hypothetical protein
MGRAQSPSTLSEYFAYLEARYGERFSLEVLTDEELARLAGLGDAALAEPFNETVSNRPLDALMGLVRRKLEQRAQHRLITSRLSS